MDLTDPMFSTFRFRVWCSTCGVSVGTDDEEEACHVRWLHHNAGCRVWIGQTDLDWEV